MEDTPASNAPTGRDPDSHKPGQKLPPERSEEDAGEGDPHKIENLAKAGSACFDPNDENESGG